MKRITLLALFLMALFPMAHAKEIAGIELPDILSLTDSPLALNGAGTRSKWFIDVYAVGLYLQSPQHDARKILAADEPMAVRLHILTDMLTSSKITEAVRDGFEQSTNGHTEPYEHLINSTLQAFADEISKNDFFNLVYKPSHGVNIYKNGNLLYSVKSGLEFKRALFGIWLSERPVQERLKKAMLAR